MNSKDTQYFEQKLKDVEGKFDRVISEVRDGIPAFIENYRWNDYSTPKTAHRGLGWWTNGFYAGILWQLYSDTKNEKYREYAEAIESKLTEAFNVFNYLHHDVGFQFLTTSVINYELTNSVASKTNALHAAGLLAGRFNLAGNFIRAWNDREVDDTRGWSIIDSMMNLKLLYWASDVTDDPRYRQLAIAHSNTVKEHAIRPDGSVKHIIEFDPQTGAYVKSYGGQGYAHGSAWTRGQGWAIVGFTVGYEETNHKDYLATAQKVADFFIDSLRPGYVVPIDFNQPSTDAYEDSSAAVLAASGLISLSKYITDGKYDYFDIATKILHRILDERLDLTDDVDNVVTQSATSYQEDQRDVALIYADYYLIEALLKVLGRGVKVW